MKVSVALFLAVGSLIEAHDVRSGHLNGELKEERAPHYPPNDSRAYHSGITERTPYVRAGEKTARTHHHHVESRCEDADGWEDFWGDGCDDYAANTTWCEVYYDELGNTTSGEEIVVTEACCVCRDSDSGPTDSGPTDSGPNHPPVASPTHSPGPVSGTAQAWVDAHNKRRSEHGKPPVSWSAELAAQAKAWTDYLVRAQSCDLVHISDTCGVGAGENLAANWSSDGGSPESPEEVCKGWTEDELVLVPTHGHEQAGHATQVLWKHSIHIGCATSSGDCGHVSACRYHPSGNFNCVHGNCVETIFDNAEELDDEPMPSTSAVEDCNQQNQPGYA